jgi:hypothetical protein
MHGPEAAIVELPDGRETGEAQPALDNAALAVALRSTQWALDDVAHDLPAGRADPDDLRQLAEVLEALAALLRATVAHMIIDEH